MNYHPAVAILVTLALSGAASAAILVDTPDPVGVGEQRAAGLIGAIFTCVDNYGNTELYEVIDESTGQYYSVAILKQVGGTEIRAAWNAQLGRTIEAVNTYFSSNGGSSYYNNKAFEQGQTGTCGEYVGHAYSSGGPYRVKVVFGGMDYTYQTTETTTVSVSVSVKTQSKFEVSLTNAGVSQSIEFGVSTTLTMTTTTTVTVKGTKKTFISNNISGGPGPIETALQNLM